MRVLIVPGTNRIAFEILRSLRTVKNIEILGAGSDVEKARNLPFDSFHFLPYIGQNAVYHLEKLVYNLEPNIIFLTHDDWLLHFSQKSKIGNAVVVISSEKSISITSFKSRTYKELLGLITVPKVYESVYSINQYPVFIKPDRGQGSKGTLIAHNFEQVLKFFENQDKKAFVITEFLPGKEFTVDCFSNSHHEVLYAEPREREEYFDGMSMKTHYVNSGFNESFWAGQLSKSLEIKGAWFFQYKLNAANEPVLLEVGLRIGGASGISRLRGVNLSLLNLYLYSVDSVKLETHQQGNLCSLDFENGFELGFKYKAVYIDLDDTLICNGKRNQSLIRYLLALNKDGVQIFVITRNLNAHKVIDSYLVDLKDNLTDVIIVPKDDLKSKFIKCKSNFLFIDDSYRERLDVKTLFGNTALVLDQTFTWQGCLT